MELRQLRYFVTVARTLNFSEASRNLFITQGTLSQQIRQLEDEMGSSLFKRNSRNVSLTEEGKALLPLAEKTLESSNECRTRMLDMKKTLSGTLSIGVTYSFNSILTESVKAFSSLYPDVKLNIYSKTASELLDMLRAGEVDFIMAFKPLLHHDDLISEELFKCNLCAIMRKDHPLSDMKSLTLDDLERQRIILPGGGLQARRTFEHFIDVDTEKLDIRMEINDPDMILDIVQGTKMIAIMSTLGLESRPLLTSIPLEGFETSMPGCIHRLKGSYVKRSEKEFRKLINSISQLSCP